MVQAILIFVIKPRTVHIKSELYTTKTKHKVHAHNNKMGYIKKNKNLTYKEMARSGVRYG